MVQMVRIALLVPTDLGFAREALLGVAEFARGRPDWRFFHSPPVATRPIQDLSQWQGEGIIAVAHTERAVGRLVDLDIPAVNISNSVGDERLPRVVSDDRLIGRYAAEHFLARGFRSFAYVNSPSQHFAIERGHGFRDRLRESGLSCRFIHDDPVVAHASDSDRDEAIARWFGELPKPVGVLVMSDNVAWSMMQICHEAGLRIPEEVAILGVDNDELLCNFCHPTLSSVQPDLRRIGHEAAALLDRLMQGDPKPSLPVRVEPLGVVTRRSTDILAIDDECVVMALRFIREHVSEHIEVEDVVEAVPLSRRVLERRFRQALGRTPFDEIQRVRIERARELLAQTNYSLEQIATLAGFNNAKRMGAVFREKLGYPPTHFRRRVLGETD